MNSYLMFLKRKKLNISLIVLSLILGGMAAWLHRQPPLALSPATTAGTSVPVRTDTVYIRTEPDKAVAAPVPGQDSLPAQVTSERETPVRRMETSRFSDADPRSMLADNPFRKEAAKLLSGRLEETDSMSRHKILSYCEHLRASYTTRDIDFIRQVFSDNALIIVGHVVRVADKPANAVAGNSKVRYSIRSKQAYLENLSRIFATGKDIDVKFSEFRIMRHPTTEGIYGVTLRQHYSCGSYSDDGYLFLLWDFRDMSMPLIHVRTWQTTVPEADDGDYIISIEDFNLE